MTGIHLKAGLPARCVVLISINMKTILLVFLLLGTNAAFSQEMHASYPAAANKRPQHKKVLQLYPNPSESGVVTITATANKELHFYIFDIEGTMVYQAVLKKKDKKTIDKLQKGTYMYTVFADDESIEEGKLVIK